MFTPFLNRVPVGLQMHAPTGRYRDVSIIWEATSEGRLYSNRCSRMLSGTSREMCAMCDELRFSVALRQFARQSRSPNYDNLANATFNQLVPRLQVGSSDLWPPPILQLTLERFLWCFDYFKKVNLGISASWSNWERAESVKEGGRQCQRGGRWVQYGHVLLKRIGLCVATSSKPCRRMLQWFHKAHALLSIT